MIVNERNLLIKLNKTALNDDYNITPSKQGGITVYIKNNEVGVFLHSKYNPVKQGEQFAKASYTNNNIAVYGLGLGYHIEPLINMLNNNQKLYIFESSLATTKIAFENTNIYNYLKSENVVFLCTDNINELATYVNNVVNSGGAELIIYDPALNAIPPNMEKLKDILFEYKAAIRMESKHHDMMSANKQINLSAGYRDAFKVIGGSFLNIPGIMVAAGPSLELNASSLIKAKEKAVVICVTRAARALEAHGVNPDFYIATDAGKWINRHLNFETMSAPLFLLSTADSGAAEYKGEKLLLFEKSGAHEGVDTFVEAGGSVATVAVSLMTNLGMNPIILIGQDLCYAFEKTHSGTIKKNVVKLKGGKYVKANDGAEYYTSGSLYIFLKWFERFFERNKSTTFLNATALGAVIKGAKNVDINILDTYPDIRDKIEAVKKLF